MIWWQQAAMQRHGFDPLSLNPLLWLDADYDGGAGYVKNGAGVSQWTDRSGRGDAARNIPQSTALNQPTWVDNVFNGHGAIRFGANKWFKSGAFSAPIAQPCSYILVQATGAAAAAEIAIDGIGAAARIAIYNDALGKQSIYAGGVLAGPAAAKAVPSVVLSVVNGTSSAVYVNNFTTPKATGNPGTQSVAGVTIGIDYSLTASQYAGDLACVYIVPTIDMAVVSKAAAYFAAKYGITLT